MIRAVLYAEMFHLMEQHPDTGYHQLSSEFMKWLDDNNIQLTEEQFEVSPGRAQYGLLFQTDEDLMAFKLMWL